MPRWLITDRIRDRSRRLRRPVDRDIRDRGLAHRASVDRCAVAEVERRRPESARLDIDLDGLIRGLSNKEIGAELGIGPDAVKRVVSRLLIKLDAPSRTALVQPALQTDAARRRAERPYLAPARRRSRTYPIVSSPIASVIANAWGSVGTVVATKKL